LLSLPVQSFAADIYTFHGEGGTRYYTNRPPSGCSKVSFPLAGGQGVSPARFAATGPEMRDYESLIARASTIYSVDPDLVWAVIKVESNFNNHAVSPKGASGLMQLMPQTSRELGVANPFDPASNIRGGVMHLSRLIDTLKGDLSLSLAAYNAGLGRVIRKKEIPAIPETRNYVKRVLNYYSELKGY
jgi:soluble lytic murein transglycosylase-like protein